MVKLRALAAAFLASALLVSCDFLMSALPQNAANALFQTADPRIEKRAAADDIGRAFGLAVADDGQVFAIGRAGVARYDADLNLVGMYTPGASLGIPDWGDGNGVEDWQASGTFDPAVIRIFGSRSGRELLLLPGGGMSINQLTNTYYYKVIGKGAPVSAPPINGATYTTSDITVNSSSLPIALAETPVAFGYIPSPSDTLYACGTTAVSYLDNGQVRKTLQMVTALSVTSTPTVALGPTLSVTLPSGDYRPLRVYAMTGGYGVFLSQTYSELASTSCVFAMYNIAEGQEPVALISGERLHPVPLGDKVYVLAARKDEDGALIYRMRVLP